MELHIFRCPSCGAPTNPEAQACEYCGSPFGLIPCPSCGTPNPVGSHSCAKCTATLKACVHVNPSEHACPTCKTLMQRLGSGAQTLEHCPKCQGLWLEQAAFYGLCTDTGDQSRWTPILSKATPPAMATAAKDLVAYRHCPICRQLMNRFNFGRTSYVIVDMCREHGTWFDPGELPKVFAFLRSGGLQRGGLNPDQYLASHIRPASNARLKQVFENGFPVPLHETELVHPNADILVGILGALLH
jgi:Zn-finger nucleic acid-binding protein